MTRMELASEAGETGGRVNELLSRRGTCMQGLGVIIYRIFTHRLERSKGIFQLVTEH